MIHSTLKQWQHTGYDKSTRKEHLILDLSLFSQLNPYFQELSEKTKIPAQTLAKRFEEIIVDISGLKEYVHAVIVRLESFNEIFEKPELRGLNKLEGKCVFDMLANTYVGVMNLAIDIPIEKGHEFPGAYVTEQQLKKAKIFSVRVNIKDIQKLDFLKKFKINLATQSIHINLSIDKPEDLIQFQRFLLDNEYPVESIILTTNLLSILKPPMFSKDQNVNLESPDRYAYHHNRTLQRFLNGSFLNILQYFHIPYETAIKYGDTEQDGQLDVYFKLFLQTNKQKNKIGDYKGGFIIPPTLLIPSLKHFHGGFEADLTITSYVQRFALISLRLAMNGEFKTLKSSYVPKK